MGKWLQNLILTKRGMFSKTNMSHLRLALLAVDDLGGDDLGGSGLGAGAQAFGLGDDHLGDGSGGRDDGWFGALNSLQTLLTLKHKQKLCEHHVQGQRQQRQDAVRRCFQQSHLFPFPAFGLS